MAPEYCSDVLSLPASNQRFKLIAVHQPEKRSPCAYMLMINMVKDSFSHGQRLLQQLFGLEHIMFVSIVAAAATVVAATTSTTVTTATDISLEMPCAMLCHCWQSSR